MRVVVRLSTAMAKPFPCPPRMLSSELGWRYRPGCHPLGGWAAIGLVFEKRGLPRFDLRPLLQLLPTQFAEASPAKGVVIGLAMSRCLGRGVRGLRWALQKINGTLRVGCGGEDRSLVVLQELDP